MVLALMSRPTPITVGAAIVSVQREKYATPESVSLRRLLHALRAARAAFPSVAGLQPIVSACVELREATIVTIPAKGVVSIVHRTRTASQILVEYVRSKLAVLTGLVSTRQCPVQTHFQTGL